jgi:KaiC/GvpD/RAD55 family RecA-like ATPase
METTVIPTGFRVLDETAVGGFKRGELVCITAGMTPRPARGASGLSQQMLMRHVRDGGRVVYHNYEGSPR